MTKAVASRKPLDNGYHQETMIPAAPLDLRPNPEELMRAARDGSRLRNAKRRGVRNPGAAANPFRG